MLIMLFPLVSLFVILCCIPSWFPTSLSLAYLEEFEHLAQQTPFISFPTPQIRMVETLLAEVNFFIRESDAQPNPSIFDSLSDAPANIHQSSDHLERIHTEIAGTFDRYVEFAMCWLIENLSSVLEFRPLRALSPTIWANPGSGFYCYGCRGFLLERPLNLPSRPLLTYY